MGDSARRREPELAEIEWEAVLTPSSRSLRRVQLAIATAQGAGAAAQAAQQIAQAEQARMLEAVANLAEADGWILPKVPVINLDAEEGTIVIYTSEAYQAMQREAAQANGAGGPGRGPEPRQRANGHREQEAVSSASGGAPDG